MEPVCVRVVRLTRGRGHAISPYGLTRKGSQSKRPCFAKLVPASVFRGNRVAPMFVEVFVATTPTPKNLLHIREACHVAEVYV